MQNIEKNVIPKISKKISDFIYEEEGNISRGKILTVGSLMLIAGLLLPYDVLATHRSHSSHSSHKSHSSHSSHRSHSSGSHGSHSSHSSSIHSSHSNVVTPKPTLPNFQKPQIPPSSPIIK